MARSGLVLTMKTLLTFYRPGHRLLDFILSARPSPRSYLCLNSVFNMFLLSSHITFKAPWNGTLIIIRYLLCAYTWISVYVCVFFFFLPH